MAKLINTENKTFGTAPGALIFTGEKRAETVRIDALRYNTDSWEYFDQIKPELAQAYISTGNITWFNVIGLHDTQVISTLGEIFGIHPLIQEDVLNTGQRAKYEEIEGQMSFFVKMLMADRKKNTIESEQVSIVVGTNFLICFQEMEGDVFSNIRERIEKASTKIRTRSTDYLAFALLDAILDHQIVAIEFVGDRVEDLVNEMTLRQNNSQLIRLNKLKRDLNMLRRAVRPMIEVATQFEKSESSLLSKKTIPFIRDLEDHSLHASEAIENYKELLNDELSNFHTNSGSRLNEIIRVLTIFSVVFIPLTFLAGIYGTNFKYLPELDYQYSYYIFWCVLIFVAAGMLYFFKRKGWL